MADRENEFSWKAPKLEVSDEESDEHEYIPVTRHRLQGSSHDAEMVPKIELDDTISTEQNGWFSTWKEPKLEFPEEEETGYKYAPVSHNFLQNSSLVAENVPKRERDETEQYEWSSTAAKNPKLEESASPPPQKLPMWKPRVQTVSDFLVDDSHDFESDMSLGSSILFDRNLPSTSSGYQNRNAPQKLIKMNYDYNYSEESEGVDGQTEKQRLSSVTVQSELNKYFEKNYHPTATAMQNYSEKLGIAYLIVFDQFEKRRQKENIHCEKDDPCERIRGFIARSKVIHARPKLSPEMARLVKNILNEHVSSGKMFSVGYVHIVMEKTNLPERYLQRRFRDLRRKYLELTPENWERRVMKDKDSLVPIEILRQLETAYLNKKYQSGEEEWGPKDVKYLAAQLGLDEEKVKDWVEKRKNAVQDLLDDDQQDETKLKVKFS